MKKSGWVTLNVYLLFNLLWLLTVLVAAQKLTECWLWVAAGFFVLQLCCYWSSSPVTWRRIAVLVLIFVSGASIDSLLAGLGLIFFKGSHYGLLIPWWLLLLWLSFALTLICTLEGWALNKKLLSLLGVLGIPLAYGLGTSLGAAQAQWLFFLVTGVVWGCLLPLVTTIVKRK